LDLFGLLISRSTRIWLIDLRTDLIDYAHPKSKLNYPPMVEYAYVYIQVRYLRKNVQKKIDRIKVMMTTFWSPGDIIVIRGVLNGKLWFASPAYIVQDNHHLIAFYLPVGTLTKSPFRRPTVEDELYNRVKLHDRNWTDHDILSLNPIGAAHSIQVMWEAGTSNLHCWYVHLQEQLRRTPIGFDTMDQMLDIVISPDQSHWRWKDEDEFNEAEQIGVYSSAKAKGIRAEGEKVIKKLHAHASPFCDGWESWRPPKEWVTPTFPVGWESYPLS
jgi:hypothetical protein